jgi:hypothetical protein
LTFLHNYREVMAAFDVFTVPALASRVLYCFFVIEHHRRRILHFNTRTHPTGEWIVQQLREAFPLSCLYRYVVFDRDRKFGTEVREFLKASEIKAVRTSVGSPWQNGWRNDGWAASTRDVGPCDPVEPKSGCSPVSNPCPPVVCNRFQLLRRSPFG